MTARELRRHLADHHGHPTRGWAWDDLVQAHGEFHRALEGIPTHTHDPDVDPAGPATQAGAL